MDKKKIAIIKLGAKGDVIRTIPLAEAIKNKHKNSVLYWITKKDISDLIEGNPYVDKIVTIPLKNYEEFDLLYNFDIDKEATALAKSIKADKKYGFYDLEGYPASFSIGGEYYLNTVFDDSLKKENKKTYQEMMFDVAEIPYKKEKLKIYLDKKDLEYGKDFIIKNKINREKLIGIHIGSSQRWPSKAWDEEEVKKFIILANKEGYEILIFGGPDEAERHEKIVNELSRKELKTYRNNPYNTNREFASLLNECKILVCGDSFALHVALALEKPTIGLFFCTSPDEVEDYGILKKIVSPMLDKFFPQRMNEYSKELTSSIKAEEVIHLIKEITKN